MSRPRVNIADLVGGGYDEFWTSKSLYRLCKGAKGSKKTKTCALFFIFKLMQYPDANLLVVRKVYRTIKDSVFAELIWAIYKLKVESLWKINRSDLELTYLPTGQKILFRGMDDPYKLASIAVTKGVLCWVWFEEFFDITSEDAFNKLTMSIRGQMPEGSGLWKQFTCTFNPWSENSWIKKRFFDNPDEDTYTCTTTFRDNEFLDEVDYKRYINLYETNPRAARVICDGDWGIAEGLIYTNWHEEDFDIMEVLKNPDVRTSFGLDFGYAISYNAFVAIAVDLEKRKLWIYDEMYEKGLTNIDIARKITELGYAKEKIWADAAEPKSIYELRMGFLVEEDVGEKKEILRYSLPAIQPALKGPDSVRNGIAALQSFEIIVHPRCINAIVEFNNYCYDQDKDGNFLDKPIKDFDHCLVAGTMVATDHGQKPIEDIAVGDMVLTHLGYRPVLASGITRPEPAEIWRLMLEDGTILEGTEDHPIETTEGLKYLHCISEGNEVITWCGQEGPVVQTMKMQNTLNTMDCCGTDIQIAPMPPRGTISSATMYGYIDMCGKNIMVQFPKGITSTIKMEISPTTTSPTWFVYHPWNICVSIPGMRTEREPVLKECGAIQNTRMHVENGMLRKKDTNGTLNMLEKLQKTCNQSNTSVNIAAGDIWQSPLMENSVQTPVNQLLEEHRELTTRAEFVASVVKNSKSTNIQRSGPVPDHVEQDLHLAQECKIQKVVKIEKTSRKEFVYDLTVDEAHDFFANGILVLNCMDAIRYASAEWFIRGRGKVVEAKGDDSRTEENKGSHGKCRRVASSVA